MAATPNSIRAELLIQLPGQEPAQVGSVEIPVVYGDAERDGETWSCKVDHGALDQFASGIEEQVASKVIGRA